MKLWWFFQLTVNGILLWEVFGLLLNWRAGYSSLVFSLSENNKTILELFFCYSCGKWIDFRVIIQVLLSPILLYILKSIFNGSFNCILKGQRWFRLLTVLIETQFLFNFLPSPLSFSCNKFQYSKELSLKLTYIQNNSLKLIHSESLLPFFFFVYLLTWNLWTWYNGKEESFSLFISKFPSKLQQKMLSPPH